MTMRLITALLVLAVSGCASSGPKTDSEIARPTERIIASDRQGMIRTSVGENAKVAIGAPPSRVLAVIKSVYDELGLPSATVDPASQRITAPTFDRMRTLGKTNLSMYFNCGDSLNGNIANTYRVYISVVTAVRPDGKGGTELETAVSGAAADMAGASSGRIPCGTTGRLEEFIHEGVRQKVSAGQ
jgi:hypothetical protein